MDDILLQDVLRGLGCVVLRLASLGRYRGGSTGLELVTGVAMLATFFLGLSRISSLVQP